MVGAGDAVRVDRNLLYRGGGIHDAPKEWVTKAVTERTAEALYVAKNVFECCDLQSNGKNHGAGNCSCAASATLMQSWMCCSPR